MPDTTYAGVLTRLFSGTPDEQAAVLDVLEFAGDADRAAVEPEIHARLRDSFPWLRLIAAKAVFRVYHNLPDALLAVESVIRTGEPAVVADAAALVPQFGASAIPLLVLIVHHAPEVFNAQTADYHRWSARTAVHWGPTGLAAWLEMFAAASADAAKGLLVGFAEAAPLAEYDLTPAVPTLTASLNAQGAGVAAGAALWRLNWRVNRAWLDLLRANPNEAFFPGVRELVLGVLVEQLGRRPDLGGLVRDNLAALAEADPDRAEAFVARLARLGSLGWAVLLPMLPPSRPGGSVPVLDCLREAIYRKVLEVPAVLPLVHHHAHAVIVAAAVPGSATALVPYAARVLMNLGSAAGMAVPDLLNLAAAVPSTGSVVGETIPSLAAGFPNTAAAVARALNRLRTSAYFGADHLGAFRELATTLGRLAPDMGPSLVESLPIDPRAVDLLLQQPAWRNAPPGTRVRHAWILADALASPRAEVRLRAAELLRHYRAEVPVVWPALVAALTGSDGRVVAAVLPYFRHTGGSADAVTAELVALFCEANPEYAARAVVALWWLGRSAAVVGDPRAAPEAVPGDGWGWDLLRGVADRVSQARGVFQELNELFAAPPAVVAERVAAMVARPESPEDSRITRWVPCPGDTESPILVDWDGLYNDLSGEGTAGALLFVALMLEYGSKGFRNQKLWMIRHHRELTRAGLAESKGMVERLVATAEQPGATTAERRRAVRDFFTGRAELPHEVTAMLEHRLAWVRWGGLELADAWGLTPERARELTEERVWDVSPRVRERAARMLRG